MSDKPIIMSAPMVRALLEGRKTQTRRVLKTQPEVDSDGMIRFKEGGWFAPHVWRAAIKVAELEPPYDIGQRLWVPEEWGVGTRPDPFEGWRDGVEYRADEALLEDEHDDLPLCPVNPPDDVDLDEWSGKGWQSTKSMPRWASRLTLIVTDVRVEQLQDISEEDAIAEGVERLRSGRGYYSPSAGKGGVHLGVYYETAVGAYRELWNSRHKLGFQWRDNPWVCALIFTVHHANIDTLSEAA